MDRRLFVRNGSVTGALTALLGPRRLRAGQRPLADLEREAARPVLRKELFPRPVKIEAVELPTGGRSGEISAYAEPILASEALTAQSANIDIVSGATYTSEAYTRSLQSALDQAGIASTSTNG